jgi:4-hydroxy-tetrahydrodipicolinate reductase
MNIALIGYGKMGKAIERLALLRGHSISFRIDTANARDISLMNNSNTDVAIEFSTPDQAFENIRTSLENGVKTISGTTGWLERYGEIKALTEKLGGTFLHSSNYSAGVNLFFELNEWLAARMKDKPFTVSMEEVHHTEKKDQPSGTAIRLAEGIRKANPSKTGWANEKTTDETAIGIVSVRKADVPGTHTVTYASAYESIEIRHTAFDRDVFASGALDVAEWIFDKTGVLTIKDFLTN